jgi:hypothetical protein
MTGHGSSGGDFSDELGLHYSPDEAAEALDMLFRLHRGELSALAPRIRSHRHHKGLCEAIRERGASLPSIKDAQYFIRY